MAVFLILASAALVFAGGRSQASGSAGTRGAKGTLPLTTGNETISILMGGIGEKLSSYEYKDNIFTRKVVDETGVKLNIIGVNSADLNQRMNLMLSAGDYPDMIIRKAMNRNTMNYYANQGIFISLDSYDPLSYPEIGAAFKDYPALNEVLRGADGKLYGLPGVDDCLHCIYQSGRGWYYLPWVRDNNRKVPETLDEFTSYLRWVRDTDVNGNGNRSDEIPLAFSSGDTKNFILYFAKAFLPFVEGSGFYGVALYDGKVTEQYRLNEFRDALRYMRSLYDEGLIQRDSFSMTGDELLALAENPTPILATRFSAWGGISYSTERFVDYVFQLPPLAGPSGQRWASNKDPWSIVSVAGVITDKAKDPDLVIALYDYLIRFDIARSSNHGPQGSSWDYPDPGTVGIDGLPATYNFFVPAGQPKEVNTFWGGSAAPYIANRAAQYGQQIVGMEDAVKWFATGDPQYRQEKFLGNGNFGEMMFFAVSNAQKKWEIPQKYFVPPLALNDADTARLADITAVLEPYKEQAFAEFITGARDINNNAAWNAYLADLDRIGSKDLVTIVQKYVK